MTESLAETFNELVVMDLFYLAKNIYFSRPEIEKYLNHFENLNIISKNKNYDFLLWYLKQIIKDNETVDKYLDILSLNLENVEFIIKHFGIDRNINYKKIFLDCFKNDYLKEAIIIYNSFKSKDLLDTSLWKNIKIYCLENL